MIVRRSMGNGEVLAAVGYHEVLSDRFYEEFQDEAQCIISVKMRRADWR